MNQEEKIVELTEVEYFRTINYIFDKLTFIPTNLHNCYSFKSGHY